ncbi:MAG: endonuclease III [Actinomycetaceae bacterium]|nr:endonuclease III [Actinomycetaceae bacterium]
MKHPALPPVARVKGITPRPGTKAHGQLLCERLAEVYPDSRCSLDFHNAFELLVATALSAQTTDARVNSVTPELFALYPSALALAHAPQEDLERILRPIGFFRAKARNLRGLGLGLIQDYEGEVPGTLEELTTLPGAGVKTANVVLGNWFGVPAITVDTHVGRLSRRLGLSRKTDPLQVEADLNRVLPRESWVVACHQLIDHGRAICTARRPLCGRCPLVDLCPSAGLYG